MPQNHHWLILWPYLLLPMVLQLPHHQLPRHLIISRTKRHRPRRRQTFLYIMVPQLACHCTLVDGHYHTLKYQNTLIQTGNGIVWLWKNTKHTKLCLATGIKAYPAIMFIGSGEYWVSPYKYHHVKHAWERSQCRTLRCHDLAKNYQISGQLVVWQSTIGLCVDYEGAELMVFRYGK